jgi:4-amino-4-deoxy-L-arabinose transferase-like glycosyltransferase
VLTNRTINEPEEKINILDRPNWEQVLSFAVPGLLLSLWVSIRLFQSSQSDNAFRWNTVIWLTSILFFSIGILIAIRWRFPKWKSINQWIRTNWVEFAAVILLVIAALLVRVIDLQQQPYAFANDEGWVGLEAARILQGVYPNLFATGWSSQPFVSFLPTSLSILIFGRSIIAVRIVSVLEGTLAVLFVYLLVREAWNRTGAFFSAAILLVMAPHIHFSRTGFNNILPSAMTALVLWLLFRAFRKRKISSYLWAGLAAGATMYMYVGCRLVIGVALALLIFLSVFRKGYFRHYWPHLLVFCLAILVVMAPQLVWFIQRPGEFFSRIWTENMFQNGWLQAHVVNDGMTPTEVVWMQWVRATMVFVYQEAPGGFYDSSIAYFPFLAAMFFVLGMGYSLYRIKKPFFFSVQIWFWSVILFGGVLTSLAPQSQRLVMAFPAAAILAGIGLQVTVQLISAFLGNRYVWGVAAAGVVVLAIAISGLGYYFGQYRQENRYGDTSNEFIYETIQLEQKIGRKTPFFVMGKDMVDSGYPNYEYLLYDIERHDLTTNANDMLQDYDSAKGALIVAIPNHLTDLEQVKQLYPDGQWYQLDRLTVPNEILYYAYYLPPK